MSDGPEGLSLAVDRLQEEAAAAINDGAHMIVLSDKSTSEKRVPVPSLLAVGAVNSHLVESGLRSKAGLISEAGDAFDVHHMCSLLGYGADAIHPHMAFEALRHMLKDGSLRPGITDQVAQENYRKAIDAGILKVMAKVGISTVQAYRGSAAFESIGLSQEVLDKCFGGSMSRIGGVGMEQLGRDAIERHETGYKSALPADHLNNPGELHLRAETTLGPAEHHMNTPQTIAYLQQAARTRRPHEFEVFSTAHNKAVERCALRGLLDFKPPASGSIPLEDVEPASEIVKKLRTGAMSYGSISEESHKTIGVAMNRMGSWSNSGEGGEEEKRWAVDEATGDLASSAIKQVASGRFGNYSSSLVREELCSLSPSCRCQH